MNPLHNSFKSKAYVKALPDSIKMDITNTLLEDKLSLNYVLPAPVKLGNKSPEAVLHRFSAKQDVNKALTGIYYDAINRYRVATDRKVLALTYDPLIVKSQVLVDNSIYTESEYPNYVCILKSATNPYHHTMTDIKTKLGILKSANNVWETLIDKDRYNSFIVLYTINETTFQLEKDYMLTILQSFVDIGCDTITVEYKDVYTPIVFRYDALYVVYLPLRPVDVLSSGRAFLYI